jgi:hypothetical protein
MFRTVLFILLALFTGCYSQEQRQGVVMVHTYFFGNDDTSSSLPIMKVSVKILFKGNLSIQEVPLINFFKDSSDEKTTFKIKHYSYLDPEKNLCLNFKNFSDTAMIFKFYSNIDSVQVDGGWNFLSDQRFQYESLIPLSDTVMDGVTYGRVRLNKKFNNNNANLDVYTNCAKKGLLIKLFKPLSDSLGCPIVRDDSFIQNKLFMTRELEFVSDDLSQDELRVFEAWENNAKKTSGRN